ncbi:MAG: hypothetical protein AAGG51_29835 [Cyanobacteria bacterium P01_G01_bin.54]
MDFLQPKLLLTTLFFGIYAVSLLRPIAQFALAQSPSAPPSTRQLEIAPVELLRWVGLRLILVVPLVGIQLL